ncbi:DNA starvation/stationary phase protection protein (plasmid) [Lichenicola cladoniae]|uniref:DNA starvation/stationary phase protection protein n=1 Tax=Lichenicola cladoniae TaxID=1484109 RepID=A0A6M8HYU2_9PROT|nr:DNA starvation/stationary phase protection protein [Lichenicola cladoniae]NPD70032.1 DNA starvation/stationary phase protection protein [Acetobacteraceae bacterium]QKE93387.1 DNA starvation/stationary phase protection protein [Lichenicola cladoniae]
MALERNHDVQQSLRQVLADTYALYGKTHGYHWNVTGPNFASLHTLFEQQYTELWASVDELAERIRSLGSLAPQGFGAVEDMSTIAGGDSENPAAVMVEDLLRGHETVIAAIRSAFAVAEADRDQVTQGLLTDRQGAHEKHAWMLRASLGVQVTT